VSNCLLFAISLYLRRVAKGRVGYISIRRSHWGWFPHFLYQERRRYGLRFVSYVPVCPRLRTIPPLLFKGRVKWGDYVRRRGKD
jgi:hypothetical protein